MHFINKKSIQEVQFGHKAETEKGITQVHYSLEVGKKTKCLPISFRFNLPGFDHLLFPSYFSLSPFSLYLHVGSICNIFLVFIYIAVIGCGKITVNYDFRLTLIISIFFSRKFYF